MNKLIAIILSVCGLSCSLQASEPRTLTGKCIGVSDGDTIKVLVDNTQTKVRLEGIDCPESHQDYGTKAKQFTSKLVFGKQVKVKVTDTDRYGRSIGRVFVDGTDVNLSLVQAGLAWHYKAYSKDKQLAVAENKAREDKVGLWSQNAEIPPWEFRRGKRSGSKAEVKGAEKGFWLNTSSNSRHNSSCKYFKNTKRGRPCGKMRASPAGFVEGK